MLYCRPNQCNYIFFDEKNRKYTQQSYILVGKATCMHISLFMQIYPEPDYPIVAVEMKGFWNPPLTSKYNKYIYCMP